MKKSIKISMFTVLSLLMFQAVTFAAKAKTPPPPPTPQQLEQVKSALPAAPSAKPAKPRRLLIVDKCEYAHRSILLGDAAFVMMGETSGAYKADVASDMAELTTENLAKYDAILLNNTMKLAFTPAQKKAIIDFVKGGKGLIGIHSAINGFYGWPEGAAMIGGQFSGHPWNPTGTWAVKLDEPNHPVNKAFKGKGFMINDEIYRIGGAYSRKSQRVLLSVDMNNETNKKQKGLVRKDNDYGVAWIKPFGKGRVFFCSLGHNSGVYLNPAILQHYLDGIQYALGDLKVDDSPSQK